jgi:hypothetical protein
MFNLLLNGPPREKNAPVACVLSLFLSQALGFFSDFEWGTFYVQVGASLCLARVIDCTKDPHCTATLQQLCPRIVKLLSSPSFLANASLLPAVAGLAQVGILLSPNFLILPFRRMI